MTDNIKLLRGEVSTDTVAKFVELIKRKGPQRQMMAFLVGLCTCAGDPVPANQEELLRMGVGGMGRRPFNMWCVCICNK